MITVLCGLVSGHVPHQSARQVVGSGRTERPFAGAVPLRAGAGVHRDRPLAPERVAFIAPTDVRGTRMALQQLPNANDQIQACIDNCFEAAQACEWCADACAGEGEEMATCIRLCRDVADLTTLHARFMARDSVYHAELADICASACEECAAECEQFDHEHCQLCAEVLTECAETCREMAPA